MAVLVVQVYDMENIDEIAYSLVNQYRVILMNEDTECGNEILCTIIAKQCALAAINFMLAQNGRADIERWKKIKSVIISM